MDLVEDLAEPEVPITLACDALGISRATLYRQTQPPLPASAPLRLCAPPVLAGLGTPNARLCSTSCTARSLLINRRRRSMQLC